MNKSQVMDLLQAEAAKNSHKAIRTASKGKLKSLGLGITDLRKIARQIGRNHALALELWQSNTFEARIIGLLIDDPKLITREQAEEQVENLVEPIFAHVFSHCNATLAKTSFAADLATDWIASNDKVRRNAGYGLLSEIAGSTKKSTPDDAFFLSHIKNIQKRYIDSGAVEGAYALLCIGKRNKKLNASALEVAKLIGPVEYDDKNCEPFDLLGHLTKGHLKRRLGLQ